MECSITKSVIAIVLLLPTVLLAAYSGGSGTPRNPYQIATKADLLVLAADANDYGKSFILTADINLSGETFTQAVITDTGFTGVFNGNNHKISNLTINAPDHDFVGLFGYVGSGGKISNLGVENVNITGLHSVGGLVGETYDATLTSCYVTGSVSGTRCVGGLVGSNYDTTLTSCHATVSVSGTDEYVGGLAGINNGTLTSCYATGAVSGTNYYVGGLVGSNSGTGTLTSCYASGSVSGTSYVGGLTGLNYYDGTITSCYATGSVSGTGEGEYVGGLAGCNNAGTGMITACSATGSVSGTNYVGGLVGSNGDADALTSCYATGSVSGTDYVGGLAGTNSGTLTACYASGSVSGTDHVGGLVGNNNDTLTACFWDTQTSGKSIGVGSGSATGVTSKTTDQMQTLSTFTAAGWDFVGETANGPNDIWTMPIADGYPILSWQKYALDVLAAKCGVTVGSKYLSDTDKVSFSGTMNATADDFNDANSSSDANFVRVTISTENAEDMDPCVFSFPVNNKTYKKGKFKSTITSKPLTMSFAFDTKKTTFSFSASNVDLTGLSCPVIVTIQVGSSSGFVSIDEAIVNGKTRPIPIHFLMGVKNSMRVDKSKFTRNRISTNITQFTISGGFSVKDLNDANLVTNPLDIAIGSQTFTVPAGNFKNTKGKFTCSKVNVTGGILAATFDFNKCTFTLTIKGTTITDPAGNADFSIDFASFSGSDVVALP